MRKIHLFILSFLIVISLLAGSYQAAIAFSSENSSKAENKVKLEAPPKILITSGDKKIPYAVSLIKWKDTISNGQDSFQSIMKKSSNIKIPYLKLGTTIRIVVQKKFPNKITLKDYILKQDGVPKYTDREVKEIPIKFIKGKGTFKLGVNWAAMLSSNSKDYEPGNTIRGFKLTCSWGDNKCEYGFIVRTDAR